jgi:hypothetical protein
MITTLDEMRDYLKIVGMSPDAEGPQDAERILGPILEALQPWDEADLSTLLLHTGMTLALERGEEGVLALREALTEMAEILRRRELIWGNPN